MSKQVLASLGQILSNMAWLDQPDACEEEFWKEMADTNFQMSHMVYLARMALDRFDDMVSGKE